jgi:hypothetical protein
MRGTLLDGWELKLLDVEAVLWRDAVGLSFR